jgi:hypothetical protein
MCIKHLGKVGVVGHHPLVVICKAIWSLLKCSTIISLTVDRVTVFALCCILGKSSRITFLACTVDHARCVGVFLATRFVQQTFFDHLKNRCVLWKRKLHQHQVIYVFDCGNFLLWRKDKEKWMWGRPHFWYSLVQMFPITLVNHPIFATPLRKAFTFIWNTWVTKFGWSEAV